MNLWKGDEEILVQYVDHMGDDDSVCDAARVSMNKSADLFTVGQNERLITYLAKHNHWSPFSHTSIKMRFKAPIFIARQLAKHQVGFAWNEVSRRYVSDEPEFWLPHTFRQKADNVKQGSLQDPIADPALEYSRWETHHRRCLEHYNVMVNELNMCPEQARAYLPQSMMTEWIWTGSLYAWSRMYNLRADHHSQREVQFYAHRVAAICRKYFPISWEALANV